MNKKFPAKYDEIRLKMFSPKTGLIDIPGASKRPSLKYALKRGNLVRCTIVFKNGCEYISKEAFGDGTEDAIANAMKIVEELKNEVLYPSVSLQQNKDNGQLPRR